MTYRIAAITMTLNDLQSHSRSAAFSNVIFRRQVKVTQRLQGYESPQDIRRLKRGDYFGEKALLRSFFYRATPCQRAIYHDRYPSVRHMPVFQQND